MYIHSSQRRSRSSLPQGSSRNLGYQTPFPRWSRTAIYRRQSRGTRTTHRQQAAAVILVAFPSIASHLISARPKKRPQYMDPGMHGTQRYRSGIPTQPAPNRNNSSILLVCCATHASLEPGRTLVMHWSVVGYGFLRGYYSPSPKPCP